MWEQEPLPIREWLQSKEHCPVAGYLYPHVQATLEHLFGGDPLVPGLGTGPSPNGEDIREACYCWGIGSGKSFVTGVGTSYILYRLGCMRDPATAFGLAPGSEIVIANVSVSEDQAKAVVFNEIAKNVDAPWFHKNFEPDQRVKSELKFPKHVRVFPGNSKSDKVLGLNVICGIIDEAAFHGEVKKSARSYMTASPDDSYSGAVELYHALQQRSQSRFGKRYMLLMISSPLYEGDFIAQKLAEYARGAPGMYAERRPQWEVKPATAYQGSGSFWINSATKQMSDRPPEGWTGQTIPWSRT